jgi:hypothetical protein
MIIKLSEVLSLIDSGKTRKEISAHFDISDSDCKKLFQHPKLKGLRAKKVFNRFEIEDDTEFYSETETQELSYDQQRQMETEFQQRQMEMEFLFPTENDIIND